MTDWIPEVSVMSEEYDLLMQLIRLCKREMAHNQATTLVLQMLGCQGKSALSLQLADAIKAEMATVQRSVDVSFRPLESALTRGEDYRSALREFLQKYR